MLLLALYFVFGFFPFRLSSLLIFLVRHGMVWRQVWTVICSVNSLVVVVGLPDHAAG